MKKVEETKIKLLDYFLEKGAITDDDYRRFKIETEIEKVEKDLLSVKGINEESIAKAKADIFGLKYMFLSDAKIPTDILNILPEDLSENYRMIAFAKTDDNLSIGLVDPMDIKAKEAADFIARSKGLHVVYHVVSETAFRHAYQQYGDLKMEVGEALKVAEDKFTSEESIDSSQIEQVVKSAPISKMVSVILKHAVESRASDVHIEPSGGESRVRYRVDGILINSLVLPKYIHTAIISRIKVMANLKIDETRKPQDGRIQIEMSGKKIDFRVSTLPLYNQEKVVMRILDTSGGVSEWSDLGFEGKNLELMQANIKKPHGMFLVTGPTGSGKSTTLYAALQILNKEEVNIVTLEDPVEYYLTGVNQSQVRPEVDFTFASGLRSILRQDPDIIMVGEIRDSETAQLAIHASLTGHFVLSTLHTNDAFGAVPRLMDMGIEPFLIASTLNIVIAQRLARTVCPECKKEVDIPKTLIPQVEETMNSIPEANIPDSAKEMWQRRKMLRGEGCSHCDKTGYKGRMAISEVLDVSEKIKNIIYAGLDDVEKLKQAFIEEGMLTLKQDGIIKALEGRTTVEEVLAKTKD